MIRVTFTDGSVREFDADGVDESTTLRDPVVRLYTKRDGPGGACDRTAAHLWGQHVRCIEVLPDLGITFDLDCKIENEKAVAEAIKTIHDKVVQRFRTAPEMAASLQPEPVGTKTPDLTKTNGEIIAERAFVHQSGKVSIGVNDLRREVAAAINGATAAERVACAEIAATVGASSDNAEAERAARHIEKNILGRQS